MTVGPGLWALEPWQQWLSSGSWNRDLKHDTCERSSLVPPATGQNSKTPDTKEPNWNLDHEKENHAGLTANALADRVARLSGYLRPCP